MQEQAGMITRQLFEFQKTILLMFIIHDTYNIFALQKIINSDSVYLFYS